MAERKGFPARRLSGLLPAHPLARDIAVILVIKVAAIVVIWWAFFSGGGGEPGAIGVADKLLSGVSESGLSPHNRS